MNQIFKHIASSNNNNALCISNKFYSYRELEIKAATIQEEIENNYAHTDIFGLVFNDDLETYATIIAIWASGKGFILLEDDQDKELNLQNIQKTSCSVIFNTNYIITDKIDFIEQLIIINPNELISTQLNLKPKFHENNTFFLYSTNTIELPKDILHYKWKDCKIALENFSKLKITLNSKDKILSFFKLSHPLSIFTFILSLRSGACFFTTPNKINRAFITFSMVDEHNLTFSFTTPYAIKMLEPFFEDIALKSLKNLLISGDILSTKHIQNILKCAPNATIYNTDYSPYVFGISAAIEIDDISQLETHNQTISAGYPLESIKYLALNHNKSLLKPGEIGELYIQNQKSSHNTSFLNDNKLLDDNTNLSTNFDNLDDHVLYKTGIIGFINNNNAIIKTANIHKQIIVNDIPIDLSLLEQYTTSITNNHDAIAIAFKNIFGYTEIHLFIQNLSIDTNTIYQELKTKLPEYLLPNQIHNINQIPIDDNSLIDYSKIIEIIQEKEKPYLTLY
jgi:D-alanine--poly(phosphoribitol) ligase subunit 1